MWAQDNILNLLFCGMKTRNKCPRHPHIFNRETCNYFRVNVNSVVYSKSLVFTIVGDINKLVDRWFLQIKKNQ